VQIATPESESDLEALQADPLADAHAQLHGGLVSTGGTTDIAIDLAQVQQMIEQHAAHAQAAVAQEPPGFPAVTGSQPMQSQARPAVPSTSAATMVEHRHAVPPQTVARNGAKRPAPVVLEANGQRRPKSEAQMSRRRERNRILAKRTRLRKKFFFEGLQKEVMDLQRENNALKDIVRRNLDQTVADHILKDANVELPSIVLENCGDATELDRQDFSLMKSLQSSQQCFVITDPSLQDNPIVYASEGFLNVTGYTREEVLGRNCRFLQGTDTSPQKVEMIRKAVASGDDVSVCIANYTADGTAFWNQLFIAALRDVENNIVNFVGVLVKVAGPGPDDPEYGKILPGSEGAQEAPTNAAFNAELSVAEITDAVNAAVDSVSYSSG